MVNKRKLVQNGKDSWYVYKADNDDEITNLVLELKENHPKSVTVFNYGNIVDEDLNKFETMRDDNAYHQLELKIGDNYLLTKEITYLRMDEEKKIVKLLNLKKIKSKKVKREPTKKELPFYGDWSQNELDLLWERPGRDIRNETKRTMVSIHEKRVEYCKNNPNFVIPLKAKFKKYELPNKVETLRNKKVQTTKIQTEKLQTTKIQTKMARISKADLTAEQIKLLKDLTVYPSTAVKRLKELGMTFKDDKKGAQFVSTYRNIIKRKAPVAQVPIAQAPVAQAPVTQSGNTSMLSDIISAFGRPKAIRIGDMVIEF